MTLRRPLFTTLATVLSTLALLTAAPASAIDHYSHLDGYLWVGQELVVAGHGIDVSPAIMQVWSGGLVLGASRIYNVDAAGNFRGSVYLDSRCSTLTLHYTLTGGALGQEEAPLAQCHTSYLAAKYALLGKYNSFLGYPTMDESATADGVGRYLHFEHGTIMWHPSSGAHEVHGAIRGKYAALHWERSFLGYPITDESPTADGVGRYNHFQGGSIFWSPATGAHEIHGYIRAKYASLNWERSALGYPVSDELAGPATGERISYFQHGNIDYTPATGAVVHIY